MAQEALSKLVAHHFTQLLTNRLSFSPFFYIKTIKFMDKLKTNNKSNELLPFARLVLVSKMFVQFHTAAISVFSQNKNQ